MPHAAAFTPQTTPRCERAPRCFRKPPYCLAVGSEFAAAQLGKPLCYRGGPGPTAMPFVSSSGKVFHVDGPSGRRKLEQKAKPLLLGSAVLLCFGAVLRQGTAAASSTLMSPAAIKAARQLQGSASLPPAPLDQSRAELPRAEVPPVHLNAMVEEEEGPGMANASSQGLADRSSLDTVAEVAAALVTNGSEAERLRVEPVR